ncbi:MAG: hypothetical protein HN601_05590 [Candidatus Marinimicrobia bacterium]|jgi:hypothetical protein|nr:hypothetical protein [Candidatus Neomarinimicrobiota bacterium]
MEKKKMSIGVYIIASAIIWGAVIIGCSLQLKNTGCFAEITYILSTASVIHLLFIWGPVAILFKKLKEKD